MFPPTLFLGSAHRDNRYVESNFMLETHYGPKGHLQGREIARNQTEPEADVTPSESNLSRSRTPEYPIRPANEP